VAYHIVNKKTCQGGKMSDLDELIQLGERFEKKYDEIIKNEEKYNRIILMNLEKMQWETYRMINDIKQIIHGLFYYYTRSQIELEEKMDILVVCKLENALLEIFHRWVPHEANIAKL